MIRRLLLLVLAVAAVMWWLRRLARAVQQRQVPTSGGSTQPVRDVGPMVRDRVCNTFLPKSRALTARVGSDEHYFCSERCREEFLAGHTVHSA